MNRGIDDRHPELFVYLLDPVATVDKGHYALECVGSRHVCLHHFQPFLAVTTVDLAGKPISRQVHQGYRIAYIECKQLASSAGHWGRARDLPTVEQCIYEGRFSDITPAHECYLRYDGEW